MDGRIDKIVENLGVIQPTFMGGAPRIFEKVRARVMTTASHGVKAKIFDWAFGVGRKVSPMRLAGRRAVRAARRCSTRLADRLVFSKIKARMGGKIRFFVSGSAPLNREVQEWFHAAGLSGAGGLRAHRDQRRDLRQQPAATRFGTVGPPVPGTAGQDRRRRRDLDQGPGRHARLPQRCRRRPPRRSRTAGSPPATSASSTSRAICGSPTGRRT